jgi:hypothetical protein
MGQPSVHSLEGLTMVRLAPQETILETVKECSGRMGRGWTSTIAAMEREHQSGPVVGTLTAGPPGPAHTKGNPHHIGAFHPPYAADWSRCLVVCAVAVHDPLK